MRGWRATAVLLLWLAPAVPLVGQSISPSGNPGPLTVSSAVAGFELTPVSDASTTLSVTTTATNQKVVARLQTALPAGTTLTLSITGISGATNHGPVSLTTSDQNIISAIPLATTYTGLTITYTLSSTTATPPVSTTVRTVVISLVSP